jgi:hypothetical protein
LAESASYTWDGGGADNRWGTPANWNPDLATAADLMDADLTFDATAGSAGGSAATPAIANNDRTDLRINALVFSGFPAASTGWTLTGNRFTNGAGGITVSASTVGKFVVVSNPVTFSASQPWTGSTNSPIELAGNLAADASVLQLAGLTRRPRISSSSSAISCPLTCRRD